MKTTDERQAEILKLATLKPWIPMLSTFGDNHHSAIEAQIWVLQHNPDEFGMYGHAGEQRWSETVTDAAVEALRWIEEADRPSLSDDWATLIESAKAAGADPVSAAQLTGGAL